MVHGAILSICSFDGPELAKILERYTITISTIHSCMRGLIFFVQFGCYQHRYINGRVCGALVQFGCYQYNTDTSECVKPRLSLDQYMLYIAACMQADHHNLISSITFIFKFKSYSYSSTNLKA